VSDAEADIRAHHDAKAWAERARRVGAGRPLVRTRIHLTRIAAGHRLGRDVREWATRLAARIHSMAKTLPDGPDHDRFLGFEDHAEALDWARRLGAEVS